MADVYLWIISATEMEKARILSLEGVQNAGERGLGTGIHARRIACKISWFTPLLSSSRGAVVIVELSQRHHDALDGDAIDRIRCRERPPEYVLSFSLESVENAGERGLGDTEIRAQRIGHKSFAHSAQLLRSSRRAIALVKVSQRLHDALDRFAIDRVRCRERLEYVLSFLVDGASDLSDGRDCPEFRVWFGHNGKKGAIPWPDLQGPKIPDAILDQLLGGSDPKTDFDPNGLLDDLNKALAERALNAENRPSSCERRGWQQPKRLRQEGGGYRHRSDKELDVPRDRQSTFDPHLIAKYQRRFPGFDEKIISMYARGMSVREIVGASSRSLWRRRARRI